MQRIRLALAGPDRKGEPMASLQQRSLFIQWTAVCGAVGIAVEVVSRLL